MRGVKKLNCLFIMALLLAFTLTGLSLPGTALGSYYTVVEGDCFWDIADKLGVDVDALQAANPGVNFEALQIGEEIVIPGTDSGDTYYGNAYSGETFSYTVASGDSLWSIADSFGTDVDSIKSASGLTSDSLQVGQVLTIPGSEPSYDIEYIVPPPAGESFTYTVAYGDSLWSIADRFGTSIESIKSASGLTSDSLQAGQELTIPGSASSYQETSRGSVSRDYGDSDGTYGELIDWSYINDMFPIGSNATLQDFETGRKFRIHHLFGTNHADCEPLTADDAAIMKDVFGGEWNWERRAAIIWLDGQPVACSMAGMPHGTSQDIYGNDFDGMFDLHFLNSRTHGTDRVDGDHQAMVRRAAGS
ncbi:LysM peptidoglycan-binding domain-containing protein [Pelotomaculum propionicicum]|uniref:LysM peptidoglycan-binding domain-containing protein n=1 Tax=Pelotomaculum propionicicum TaxID=258475 RepID=UPI003B7F5549